MGAERPHSDVVEALDGLPTTPHDRTLVGVHCTCRRGAQGRESQGLATVSNVDTLKLFPFLGGPLGPGFGAWTTTPLAEVGG